MLVTLTRQADQKKSLQNTHGFYITNVCPGELPYGAVSVSVYTDNSIPEVYFNSGGDTGKSRTLVSGRF